MIVIAIAGEERGVATIHAIRIDRRNRRYVPG
jgi:hypothetical protein